MALLGQTRVWRPHGASFLTCLAQKGGCDTGLGPRVESQHGRGQQLACAVNWGAGRVGEPCVA